jgi:hypothetical protein
MTRIHRYGGARILPHWLAVDGVCTECGELQPAEGSDCPGAKADTEAHLGCATTEELLREIVARLEDSPTVAMRHVAYWCRSAADWGPVAEREYRTVDS